MKIKILILGLTVLASCGTPQQQCIGKATREIRVLDRLIHETQENLDRGYALDQKTISSPEWVDCPRYNKKGKIIGMTMCMEDRETTIAVPVAIDPGAEGRKLAGLQSKRHALEQSAAPQIAACKATYPE